MKVKAFIAYIHCVTYSHESTGIAVKRELYADESKAARDVSQWDVAGVRMLRTPGDPKKTLAKGYRYTLLKTEPVTLETEFWDYSDGNYYAQTWWEGPNYVTLTSEENQAQWHRFNAECAHLLLENPGEKIK